MDHWVPRIFWASLIAICLIIVLERLPRRYTEGFESGLVGLGNSKFWAKLVPRRGDVGPDAEQDGFTRDDRYFKGYADVQRFSSATDWCRMVQKGKDPKDKFLACALGGTENLSSTSYRSPSVKDGFILGRDDYMRDIDGDGRADYCRIVKRGIGEFRSECNQATDSGFMAKMVPDNNPPEEVANLLMMYEGCVFWLRLRDDMVDYAQNLYVSASGQVAVEENPPRPTTTDGLVFNGQDQFVRIGDDPYLNFGSDVRLRNLRGMMFWVKFDEFTNNAHIFDFGNGAGIDNVWVGILNRGNLGTDALAGKKGLVCGNVDSTVPDPPSGAQTVQVVSPQELMKTTDANVEEFTCDGFAVAPKKVEHSIRKTPKTSLNTTTADMCYEIWDKDQRKQRIIVPNMFEKGKWTHVCITTEGTDSFRPDIAVWRNGQKVYVEPSGWLPQTNETEKNYIGKSNWSNVTSQYANKDELFKGSLFDFRGYQVALGDKAIKVSYEWGVKLLGLE